MSDAARSTWRRAFDRAVGWNLASFAVISACGLAVNLLVGRFYEPWVLGVFNFTLAVFVFGGQLGAFAIQYSVLYHTPGEVAAGRPTAPVLTTALLLAAIVSAPVALIVWVASGWLAVTFDSPAAAQALGLSASGLFLFPLNKILLSHANGLRRVRLYALAIAARLLFVVGGVAVFVAAGLDGAWIGLTLAAAEWALFLVLVVALRTELRRVDADTWTRWRRRHLRFGSRGVAGAVLFELNTRVDVFVLAFLTDMDSVGVYSMATIFVEGLFQLLIVLRWSYDPQIARLVVEQRHAELIGLVRSGRRLAYGGMLAVGALAVALYPWVVELLVGRAAYDPSAPVFALLAAGVILSAGYVPFSGLLQQAGHPGAQSLLLLAVVLTNLLGKLALVPAWGLLGAAAAFSFAQVAFVFYLRLLVRRRVGLAI